MLSLRFCLLFLLLAVGTLPGLARGKYRYWAADYDSLRRVLTRQRADTARLRTLVHLLDVTELTEARRRAEALPLLDELLQLNQRQPRLADAAAYRQLRRGLGLWVQGTDDAQAMRLLHRAVSLFDSTRRPIPRLLIDLAPLYNRLHQSEERRRYFQRKLAYYQLHGPAENAAACHLVLGGSYRHLGDYNRAISSYLRAADLFQHFDRMLYTNELMVAGYTYADWGNSERALHYLLQAAELEDRHHLEGLRRFFTLRALSQLYQRQGQLAAADRYADLALQAARRDSADRPLYTTYALLQKGAVLVQQRQLGRAYGLLQRAQQLSDSLHLSISGRPGDFTIDETWARYHAARGDVDRAEQHWLQAYQKATASRFNMMRPRLLRELIRLYDARQQPEEFRHYTRIYLALTDSLAEAQNTFHVAQYEGERAEQAHAAQLAGLREQQAVQALRLRQRNGLLALALLTVAAVSGLGAVLYRQLRVNRQTLAELRKAQNQLVAAEKWAFVGEVSAGIAHELQNPLHFMKRFAEVSTTMLDGMQPAADGHRADNLQQEILVGLKQNLQEISQHGLRASAIIRDMLAHSRAGTTHRQLTDLNALVREQARLAYEGLQAQDVHFHATLALELEAQLAPLSVVPQDLGRAVLNLLTNAFQAVRQRSRTAGPAYAPAVHISTRRLEGQVEIRVRDNGVGMNAAVQARIFQPFFTTKAVGEGTGLGLSLSHDIITKGHGGTLRVQTREGEFTEFIITLPA
ncbi:hypothetical protein EJV47_06270 [Hymenobacter gummosus]|uniref:histidine kinase n=1 Tax=Hymenobacter gummosus TaxID=1776032 RepID=A0A431U5T7_9BACT|nr:ATP-binding protein [Hymenobacter gummosus]RTQ51407.1 hypothetical protein EJV47_06270 [Hymenobacter gummosus]